MKNKKINTKNIKLNEKKIDEKNAFILSNYIYYLLKSTRNFSLIDL
jgi:hypothetical protein